MVFVCAIGTSWTRTMTISNSCCLFLILQSWLLRTSYALSSNSLKSERKRFDTDYNLLERGLPFVSTTTATTRRDLIFGGILTTATLTAFPRISQATGDVADKIPDSLDVENYLRTGFVTNPMGVSGQAGKSRPETGVFLRDGSEVSRDSRTGDVLAEILVQPREPGASKLPVLASFQSPWPLAVGTVFDVECRNAKTGDGSFLAVTSNTGGKSIEDLPNSFFLESLIAPTSRFSFYGTPTDVKIKKSEVLDHSSKKYRIIDMSFSTLSQSTQTEIPRRARIVATIPDGAAQAVMLVGSASAQRWNRGSSETITAVAESFRAIPAPSTSLKVRAKERRMG